MASLGPEPGGGGGGGGPRVPASGWYRGPAPPGVLSSGEDVAPAAPEGQGSCRRRNVLTERERRKRISASCERLRSLLPHFDGRREDMASVLEMAVHFLRLSRALVPGEEPQGLLAPAKDVGPKRPRSGRQSALGSPRPVGAAGARPCSMLARQDPPSCAAVREDEREGPLGLAEGPDRRTALPELPGLAPAASDPSVSKARDAQDPPAPLPRWPVLSQRPVSPLVSLEAQGWPGRAVPLGWGPASPEGPEEADGAAMPAPDSRPASGSPVEDSSPFLLTASPDWWLGPPEGRGSPLDRAEPAFLAEPEPGLQLLQDSLLAQWGSDLGCSGLALREEADGSFPDVFACCL